MKPLTFEKFKESLLGYKSKREILAAEGSVEEDLIKSLWNNTMSSPIFSEITPPKGIDPITKEKVAVSYTHLTLPTKRIV